MIENPHCTDIPRCHHLLNLLIDHVGADHLQPEDLDRLHEIDRLVPRNVRFPGGRLWRVMVVPLDAAEMLYNGFPCVFPSRIFSSWSKASENLLNLQRRRAREMHDDEALLLFSRNFSFFDHGIDIKAIFKVLDPLFEDNNPRIDRVWEQYIIEEEEVIWPDHQGVDFRIMPYQVEKIRFFDGHEIYGPITDEGPERFEYSGSCHETPEP